MDRNNRLPIYSQLSADVHPLTTSHWSNIDTRVRTILHSGDVLRAMPSSV